MQGCSGSRAGLGPLLPTFGRAALPWPHASQLSAAVPARAGCRRSCVWQCLVAPPSAAGAASALPSRKEVQLFGLPAPFSPFPVALLVPSCRRVWSLTRTLPPPLCGASSAQPAAGPGRARCGSEPGTCSAAQACRLPSPRCSQEVLQQPVSFPNPAEEFWRWPRRLLSCCEVLSPRLARRFP